jgi:hypothetical protein
MADEIRICVLALTFEQRNELTASELAHAGELYNLNQPDQVYGDSPDDWRPFEQGESVYELLNSANLTVISTSFHLKNYQNPQIRDTLSDKVDLYIFDPLFLLLDDYHEFLIFLQGRILGRNAEFCIVIPDRVPNPLREYMRSLCEQKLADLKKAYEEGKGGNWDVRTRVNMIGYLNKWRRQRIASLPSQDAIAQSIAILSSINASIQGIQGMSAPQNYG